MSILLTIKRSLFYKAILPFLAMLLPFGAMTNAAWSYGIGAGSDYTTKAAQTKWSDEDYSVCLTKYLKADLDPTYWNVVTDREFFHIHRNIHNIDQALRAKASNIPQFFSEPIFEGTRSLLSLGEGESTFISDMLEQQSKLQEGSPLANIYAVDGTFSEKVRASKYFAGHYREELFQNLAVLDKDGKPIKFDDIVSSNAFTYVLGQSSDAEKLHLLEKLSENLRPGGVFRGWGKAWPNLGKWLQIHLPELKARGLFSSYEFERKGRWLVLQK
jgi:hypothetical protein